jgi:hypothetical protein
MSLPSPYQPVQQLLPQGSSSEAKVDSRPSPTGHMQTSPYKLWVHPTFSRCIVEPPFNPTSAMNALAIDLDEEYGRGDDRHPLGRDQRAPRTPGPVLRNCRLLDWVFGSLLPLQALILTLPA